LPGLALTTAALMVFMFVPTFSKGLVNISRGTGFYESFPWDGEPTNGGTGNANRVDLGALSDEAKAEAEQEAPKLNEMGDEYYFGDGQDPGALPTEADGDGGPAPAADGDAGPTPAADSDAGVAEPDADEYQGVQL
jgi:hypothetical protein